MALNVLDEKRKTLGTLKQSLHQFSAPAAAELIRRGEGGDVQCFACGHRCVVKPGRDGVCRVRFNEGGELKVPFGYVGPLACDPIEKKPFFHVLPGSDALTFGMLGCDYHCGYCFTPDTVILTDRGPMTFADAFASAPRHLDRPDSSVALPDGSLRAVAASGQLRAVRGIVRHPYAGRIAVVKPFYLPELRCTPGHSLYATTDPAIAPQKVQAQHLTADHYLAVPRRLPGFTAAAADGASSIDVAAVLAAHRVSHHVRWKLSPAHPEYVMSATAAGATSAEIATELGTSGSCVRHVRSKLAKRGDGPVDACTSGPVAAPDGTVRFPHERRPGLPASLPLSPDLATLLGFYCAEGCSVPSKSRPNSHVLNFSFSPAEGDLADSVRSLLDRTLGVTARLVRRPTTIGVVVGKSSAALLFSSLAGARAVAKRVPTEILCAPDPIASAFLDAYVRGDGHRYANGKVSVTTVSAHLAYGIAALALRLGHFASVYDTPMPPEGRVEGRAVRRAPHQYSVVWYDRAGAAPDAPCPSRRLVTTGDYHLVPLRSVSFADYDGDVYNMEVEEEHNYLANLMLVANCQNWVTSQMLRDPDAVGQPRPVTPRQLVDVAVQNKAPVVASSYNEPLITSEWAVAVFKEARARGLRCAYISNGNGTPEVLDFLRPHVEAYKVDLKTFNPRNYRQLGGVLENVMQTIQDLKQRGFWVEIVTLVVPGFSDDADDLKRMAGFLASVDPLMPWHMTAFHPDYKMTEGYRQTTVDDLMKIVEYGRQAGLRYLYPGNLPGQVGEWENTRCHHCETTLIRRWGFLVRENRTQASGNCPACHKPVPGIWGTSSGHGDGRVRAIL